MSGPSALLESLEQMSSSTPLVAASGAGGLADLLTTALGMDLRAWAVAVARILPSVVIVPAFGLRAVAAPIRIGLALGMAAAIVPAVRPVAEDLPLGLLLVTEAARGLPIAISAAAALWAAAMAGGLMDDLRADRTQVTPATFEGSSTPTGALLGMLVALVFLESGGPRRIVEAALAVESDFVSPLARSVVTLEAAIGLAVAAAAPVIVAAILIEVAGALTVRAASPAFLQPVVAPLRSIGLLLIAALVLDRVVELVALLALRTP